MIKVQGKLDREVYVACSGGVDSMAVVDFLMRNHKVNLMFFDHRTETSSEALEFLTNRYYPSITTNTVRLYVGHIERNKQRTESWEEFWRNERYRWFHSYSFPIITCLHREEK